MSKFKFILMQEQPALVLLNGLRGILMSQNNTDQVCSIFGPACEGADTIGPGARPCKLVRPGREGGPYLGHTSPLCLGQWGRAGGYPEHPYQSKITTLVFNGKNYYNKAANIYFMGPDF